MPDEVIITQLESLFNEIVELGAEKERTRMVPNLLITNDTPAGFPDFIVVKDDRDGDNILATKVPGVIYATNDLVNVLFVRGGEAIAFQQGSQSGNSGIWEIVPGTSTDIVYAQGDVGIGKTIAPDATLEILDTAQAQLRLTHTEDTKFVDFTLDTNHDLTIKPSSTGQIKLQPTTDSTDFFQVLDADGGNPVLNVDSTNEIAAIGTDSPLSDSFGLHRFTVYTTTNVGLQFGRFSNDTGGPIMSFVKSRNATIGQHTAVQAGDRLGTIAFSGSDGVDFSTPADMAQIYAEVDAITGGTIYSGRLKFQTVNTSGSQVVAMTIDDSQNVGIGTTPSATAGDRLEVYGGAATNSWVNIDADAGKSRGFRTLTGGTVKWHFQHTTGDDFGIFDAVNTAWRFWVDGSNGDIGINGVTSPSTELDIGAGAIEFAEMTAPGAGAVNTARLYAVDNGAGKTQLAVIFNTGAVQVLATQP